MQHWRSAYAVEHTGIEPFDGHVKLQTEAPEQLRPIREAVEKTLSDNECLQLNIPLKKMDGLKKRELQKTQAGIIRWVTETAPNLPIVPYGKLETSASALNATIPDVPFELSLYRWRADFGGPRFQVCHIHDGSLEEDRLERIQRAYDKKISKLDAWKKQSGARSVLILEDNDIQLTNPEVVAQALIKIEETRTEKPDEIYLVTTCAGDPWWIWAMRIDEVGYYALRRYEGMTTEISPINLVDTTAFEEKSA